MIEEDVNLADFSVSQDDLYSREECSLVDHDLVSRVCFFTSVPCVELPCLVISCLTVWLLGQHCMPLPPLLS